MSLLTDSVVLLAAVPIPLTVRTRGAEVEVKRLLLPWKMAVIECVPEPSEVVTMSADPVRSKGDEPSLTVPSKKSTSP